MPRNRGERARHNGRGHDERQCESRERAEERDVDERQGKGQEKRERREEAEQVWRVGRRFLVQLSSELKVLKVLHKL